MWNTQLNPSQLVTKLLKMLFIVKIPSQNKNTYLTNYKTNLGNVVAWFVSWEFQARKNILERMHLHYTKSNYGFLSKPG